MDLHWRNTQKPARFFAVDARAASAVMLCLVHVRLWTIAVVVVTMLVFWIAERRGLTFESALRAARAWFLGRNRPGLRSGMQRRTVDFG